MAATPQDVIGFWRLAGPEKWFSKNSKFDDAIALKFEPVHLRAARGEYDAWAATHEGSLALLILLDQFPRNLYRNSGHAFATDPKARQIARTAISAGHDKQVDANLRQFFYLPFEHSEDPVDQERSVAMFQALGEPQYLEHALIHREVISRFGRFPHRNAALGRIPRVEELEYLANGGFSA